MGIINGLLTGGVLVGKICQAIGGIMGGKAYQDGENGVSVSEGVSIGDVKFFGSTAGGTPGVYAFNKNTDHYAEVVVPNTSGKNGVVYTVAPTQKVPFAEATDSSVPPEVEVTAGLTNSPTTKGLGGNETSLFTLSFEGLKSGEWINVGSFKLSCDTTQLIITSIAVVAGMLTYFYFRSNKGVAASNQNPIPPKKQLGAAPLGDSQQSYAIDFSSLNIDVSKDVLSGSVQFEIAAAGAALGKLSKVPSEPLHPAELRFFRLLEEGKIK